MRTYLQRGYIGLQIALFQKWQRTYVKYACLAIFEKPRFSPQSTRLCKQVLKTLFASALLFAVVTAAFPACARDKDLGRFGAWHAYAQDQGGQTVCYMVTTKTVKSPKLKRAAPYLMITHRPVEASTDVFSYGAGAMLNSKHGAIFHVGTASFDLFSVRDIAWARDGVTDHKIAAAIRNAATAQATGFITVKKRTRKMTDIFDLTGSADAYHAIGKACGLIHDKPAKTARKHASPPKK